MKPKLKGRNHGPRCCTTKRLSFHEKQLLRPLSFDTVVVKSCYWWRTITVYDPFDVMGAMLPLHKFRIFDDNTPLDKWLEQQLMQ